MKDFKSIMQDSKFDHLMSLKFIGYPQNSVGLDADTLRGLPQRIVTTQQRAVFCLLGQGKRKTIVQGQLKHVA